jgi:hypothetical protein
MRIDVPHLDLRRADLDDRRSAAVADDADQIVRSLGNARGVPLDGLSAAIDLGTILENRVAVRDGRDVAIEVRIDVGHCLVIGVVGDVTHVNDHADLALEIHVR